MIKLIFPGVLPFFLGLLLLLPLGCEDKRRHGANNGIAVEEVSPPVSADAQPGDVATALLAALNRAQDARAHGLGNPDHRQAYEKALAEIRSLMARSEVVEQLRTVGSTNVAKDISDEAALTATSESWVSLVAHYVNGVMPETLRVLAGSSQTAADVHVIAESPEDKAVIASLSPSKDSPTTSPATSQPALGAAARQEALARGVNPLFRADITIRLKNVDGRWRVTGISLGPTGMTFLPTAPARMPAVSTQPSKT
jgi:hypothetical protein